MKRLYSLAYSLALGLIIHATCPLALALPLPLPELETLPNGLQIAWYPNNRYPVTDLTLLIKNAGFRFDPPGKSGTVELLAASLDRGAGGLSAQQLAHAIERLGASRSISAEDDTISLGIHGLSPDAPELLDLLAKIALHPDFPDAEILKKRSQLLEQWRHIGDSGESLASLAFDRILTVGTPYERGPHASAEEFAKITPDEVRNYYQKHFRPDHSLLLVVGRFDRASFRERIVQHFGLPARAVKSSPNQAPNSTVKKSPKPKPPLSQKLGQIVIIHRADLNQSQVRIGFRAPLFDSPEHAALVVGNTIIGESFHSRLNQILREKLGLTYAVGSAFGYTQKLGRYSIGAATLNETTGRLIHKTIELLKELKAGKIEDQEVRAAQEFISGRFSLDASTPGAVAGAWLSATLLGAGPHYVNDFLTQIAAVRTLDVKAALAKHFDLDQLIIVVAGDAPEIIKSLKAAKLNSYRVLSPHDLF